MCLCMKDKEDAEAVPYHYHYQDHRHFDDDEFVRIKHPPLFQQILHRSTCVACVALNGIQA